MTLRRPWLFAILVVLAGCRDAAAPLDGQRALAEVVGSPLSSTDTHILQQSPTAPALETYQVSFWTRRDRASTVIINYQPTAGETVGLPFLRFDIPRGGLQAGPDGRRLGRDDSLFITLTIDPQRFAVEFEPSGVVFSRRHPATLAIWYGNANPDLNGDGIVDEIDQTLAYRLAIWVREAKPTPWLRTSSVTETGQQWVWTTLRHFSEYAVSWYEYAVSW